jgi:hypothetical protein
LADERAQDAELTYTCAICCDTIRERDDDWRKLTVSHPVSPARQEFYVHTRCLTSVLGSCVPLGEVFD